MKIVLALLLSLPLLAQDQPVEHREPIVTKSPSSLVSGSIVGTGFGNKPGTVRSFCMVAGHPTQLLPLPDGIATSWTDTLIKIVWKSDQVTKFAQALGDVELTVNPKQNACWYQIVTYAGYKSNLPTNIVGMAR